MRRHPAVFAILAGGGIAATLDIIYAIMFSAFRGVAPVRVLQSVASGLLGRAAYEGGAATASLGLLLHYLMGLLIAAIFWFPSRKLAFMTRRPALAGLAYGACIYVVMNFVVVPLSAFPTPMRHTPTSVAINLAAQMLLFGLPIALAARAARVRPN